MGLFKKSKVPYAILLFLFASSCLAAVPQLINYQGRLADGSGNPLDTTVAVRFTIYDAEAGGLVIWSETQPSVTVVGGVFNVLLGSVNSISDTVFSGTERWLGIRIGNDPEISPRSRLVSVGYSHRVSTVDGAKGGTIDGGPIWTTNHWSKALKLKSGNAIQFESAASSKFGLGASQSGDRLYFFTTTTDTEEDSASYRFVMTPEGRIGIGTNAPDEFFHVMGAIMSEGTAGLGGRFVLKSTAQGGHQYEWYLDTASPGSLSLFDRTEKINRMTVDGEGDIGIGTDNPLYKLHVDESSNTDYIAMFRNGGGSGPGVVIESGSPGADCPLLWVGDYTGTRVSFYVNGNGRVGVGTTSPTQMLDVVGTTKTQVLEITGGSDLAEPFPVSKNEVLPAGAVVVIDENNPGYLKLSTEPYDKRVAGVVSGAGGIKPGLTLRQDGTMEGNQNIALTGRVYVLASTENGAIKPGDLLTTSSIPGHAMKATNSVKSNGAIIGKSMSELDSGEGFVLVLVNLQ